MELGLKFPCLRSFSFVKCNVPRATAHNMIVDIRNYKVHCYSCECARYVVSIIGLGQKYNIYSFLLHVHEYIHVEKY